MSPNNAKKILENRKPIVIRARGNTRDNAYLSARNQVPATSHITKEELIAEAEIDSIKVEAYDEDTARADVMVEMKKRFGERAVITEMNQISHGSGGLFGLGKKPNIYSAVILVREAEYEITCLPFLTADEWNQLTDDIQEMNANKDVDGLIYIFNSLESSELRRQAIAALGKTGDERALDLLISVCMEPDHLISPEHTQATIGLGNFRDARVISPLMKVLKSRDYIRRRCALDSLGRIHDLLDVGLVLELVLDSLNDPSDLVREGAEVLFIQLDTSHNILENQSILPDEIWIKVAAQRIANLYRANPDGFVRGEGGVPEMVIREIGAAVNRRGGMDLMLQTHAIVTQRTSGITGASRNLEHIWDGIGEWRG